MKKTLYLFLFAAALAACNPPTTNTTDTGNTTPKDSNAVVTSPPDSVRIDTAATVVDNGTATQPTPDPTQKTNTTTTTTTTGGRQMNPNGQVGGKMFGVSGHILIAGTYCGGAAPTPDIEAEARRPKPFANQSFLIREGKTNVLGANMVTRVMTDAKGDFRVDLRPGTYCMVLAEKENVRDAGFFTQKYITVDKTCDSKWLTSCDLSFTVADKNISGLRLTFNKQCNLTSLSPCLTWTGPMPPAAAPRGK